jgi:hypothetical protein
MTYLLRFWMTYLLRFCMTCLLRFWMTYLLRFWMTCILRFWMTYLLRFWMTYLLRFWMTCLLRFWMTCLLRFWMTYSSLYFRFSKPLSSSCVFRFLLHFIWDRDSVIVIETRYGLYSPGIESLWRAIFRTRPDRSWSPLILLYSGVACSSVNFTFPFTGILFTSGPNILF